MDYTIKRLSAADFEEYIDFIDLVFSADRNPHDFRRLLPKLYQPDDEHMCCHYAVIQNGRIRATVGKYPQTIHIAGRSFQACGIGAVATHRDYEGKGLMKALMNRAMEDMAEEGVQLSALGGLRQRYGYYGYEKCGLSYRAELNRRNIQQGMGKAADLVLTGVKAEDEKYLAFIAKLQRAQPWYAERPAQSLHDILRSWYGTPYIALCAGELVGYLVESYDGREVSELFVLDDDANLFNGVLQSYLKLRDSAFKLHLPAWKPIYIRQVSRYAEEVVIEHDSNWRIFDFAAVAEALFAVKSNLVELKDGEAVIGIEGYGSLTIKVSDGRATVSRTLGQPDFTLDALTAMRLLFGPLSPEVVVQNPLTTLLSSWFPLPLCGLSADGV